MQLFHFLLVLGSLSLSLSPLFVVTGFSGTSSARLSPSASSLRTTTVVLRSRPDSSAAVADALRASKEYGGTSKEARIAWEIVEEMDASDLSPAMTSSASASSLLSDEELHQMEYTTKMRSMNRLLEETEENLIQIKTLAANLKQLDIEDPDLSKLPETATGLKTVLQEAKAASEVYGPESSESVAAWNEVDFCTDVMDGVGCNVDTMYHYSADALKAHHVYDAVIDATFFQEAEDAIEMLENLRRFVRVETNRLKSVSP